MAEIMKMMFLVAFLLLHAESVEGYEFRLSKPTSQDPEGFVEIFYDGSWGLIGNPEFRFSDDTASLLCRKFKLSMFGYGARNIYQYGNTFSHFWLQKLECNGNEQSIDECVKTDDFRRTQFIKDEGTSLQDYGSKLYCVDYRLMGGLSPNTGMLLAAFSGTEHSMCYQGFDSSAGDVVCKHLRYNGLVAFTEGDPGSIPLFNNTLTCTGNESSLNECTMSNAVIENCTRAVYITCKAVRLTTWNEHNDEGTVEIFYNGSWGYLSSWEPRYGFNDVTAQFLCETFGFRFVCLLFYLNMNGYS
ncbi:neurotrypsin-like [Ruditapes philippinarum]|uniref:neurotrypsin-like n=1 Tax=Ruditapes philippinarum TaxID=129788 RepID=UPI00295BC7EC|nr:neurotrypsin-like [Ruditapes philippinarum]XP_060576599.1 neurotrypsin-like [Ruditapes philippinarum]